MQLKNRLVMRRFFKRGSIQIPEYFSGKVILCLYRLIVGCIVRQLVGRVQPACRRQLLDTLVLYEAQRGQVRAPDLRPGFQRLLDIVVDPFLNGDAVPLFSGAAGGGPCHARTGQVIGYLCTA